jgi:hypothetical protein
MKKSLMLIAAAVLTLAGSAGADDKAPTPAATPSAAHKPYGLAGCGLGAILFDDKLPVLAATTNATSGSQTFGITSGTSHCQDTAPGSASTKVFIEANRAALSKEIARGKGETLESLSALAGCADTKAVSSKLQKSFKTIFPSQTVSDASVSDAIVSTLKSDASLSCGALTST